MKKQKVDGRAKERKIVYEELNPFFKLTKKALFRWKERLIIILSKTVDSKFSNIFKYNIDIIRCVIYYYFDINKEFNLIKKSGSVSLLHTKSLQLDDEYKLYVKDYILSIAKQEFELSNEDEQILKELL
jgi:uncharacterized protein (DUF2225 family)